MEKSRQTWLKAGVQNSACFSASIREKRTNMGSLRLCEEEVIVTDKKIL